jgi:hypothetical protein
MDILILPVWLWVIWFLCLLGMAWEYKVRGVIAIVVTFATYLVVRHFTPQLGPWEQYGVYMLIVYMNIVANAIAGTGDKKYDDEDKWKD